MKKIIILLFVFLSATLRAEPVSITYSVATDDPKAKKLISSFIDKAVKTRSEIEVTNEDYHLAEFFVMAQRNTESKNPNSWMFSITHTTNAKLFMALTKLNQKGIEVDDEIMRILASMISEQGYLKYMNIVYIDNFNEQNLKKVMNRFVNDFADRIDNYLP